MMGGKESVDFLAPSGSGENTLVTCENGDFAADLEVARGIPRAATFPDALAAPKEVATPGVTTIEALAEMLGVDAAATSKAMPVVKSDGTLVLGLVRGDDRLSEPKMLAALESDYRPRPTRRSARRSARAADRSGPSGSTSRSSPTRHCAKGSTSPVRIATAGISSASRPDGTTRRGSPTSVRRTRATRAPSAVGRSASRSRSRSGTSSSSEPATRCPSTPRSSTRTGTERPLIGGSYGIGPARMMAAAVEQSHDENGIVWPESIAPYDVHVLALHGGAAEVLAEAEHVASTLSEAGYDVLLDDRDERPGEKFADADLVGSPAARDRRQEDARRRCRRRPATGWLGGGARRDRPTC